MAERIADDDAFSRVFPNQFLDSPEVVRHARALERGQPLGGDPQGIRDCQTYPLGAKIDGQNACRNFFSPV